jgi:hypothetical protein
MDTLPENIIKIITSDDFITKIYLFETYWSVNDCLENKECLFVFGDNDIKRGCKGQAIIRNCSNAIGIPTKKFPNNKAESFYTDTKYRENCKKIMTAVADIIASSVNYDKVYFPKNGLGTGLSQLPIKAPKTNIFLNKIIFECFGINYT